MNKKNILVVDDERDIRNLLCISLERMGYKAKSAAGYKEAVQLIRQESFDMCLSDVCLPDGTGLELISDFKAAQSDSPIAIMTAFDTTDIAVDAMKRGAFDFLPKPIQQKRLQSLVNEALSQKQIINETDSDEELITGNAECIERLRSMVYKVSKTLAPVLIMGESGTGKERTARSIHQKSNRSEKPFIAVNCGAIPSELMESEFFGHKKGSFTGAHTDKQGLFQAADGGTLFLDEVADLPLSMQVKLLRAIQEKAIRSIGSQEETVVNIRVLSATHKDMAQEVIQGNFRQDLYYRLNVIELMVPALKNRKEDIENLSTFILSKQSDAPIKLDGSALELLKSYDFPGNIRELENILQRALVLCTSNTIFDEDINLPSNFSNDNAAGLNGANYNQINSLDITDLEQYLETIERNVLEDVLRDEGWSRANTAKRLGLTDRQFRYKVTKYDLKKNPK